MKRFFLTLLLLLISVGPAASYTQFSIQGLGEPLSDATAREVGMGVLGIATTTLYSLSQTNPALVGDLQFTTFSATLSAAHLEMDDHNYDSFRRSATVPNIRLVLPVFFDFKVGFGITQRTMVDYHSVQEYDFEGIEDGLKRTVTATGGLNALRLVLAHKPVKYVSLGFQSDLLFGSIERQWLTEFSDDFIDYSPVNDRPTLNFKGADFTYGVHLRPHPKVSLGAMLRNSVTIDTKTKRNVRFQNEPIDTTESDVTLPMTFGFGISIHPSEQLHLVGDVKFTHWEDLEFGGQPVARATDTRRFGVGLEWRGDPKADTWYERIPLRIGYADEPWYINHENGGTINGYFWSLGTTVDLFRQRGFLDVAFTYGRRGSNNLQAMEERLYQLTMTAFGFETWF